MFKLDEYFNRNQSLNNINSHLVHLNLRQKDVLLSKPIHIQFRHLVSERRLAERCRFATTVFS